MHYLILAVRVHKASSKWEDVVPSVSVRAMTQTLKRQTGTFKDTILMCVVFTSEDTNHICINEYDEQAEKTMTSCFSSEKILN